MSRFRLGMDLFLTSMATLGGVSAVYAELAFSSLLFFCGVECLTKGKGEKCGEEEKKRQHPVQGKKSAGNRTSEVDLECKEDCIHNSSGKVPSRSSSPARA